MLTRCLFAPTNTVAHLLFDSTLTIVMMMQHAGTPLRSVVKNHVGTPRSCTKPASAHKVQQKPKLDRFITNRAAMDLSLASFRLQDKDDSTQIDNLSPSKVCIGRSVVCMQRLYFTMPIPRSTSEPLRKACCPRLAVGSLPTKTRHPRRQRCDMVSRHGGVVTSPHNTGLWQPPRRIVQPQPRLQGQESCTNPAVGTRADTGRSRPGGRLCTYCTNHVVNASRIHVAPTVHQRARLVVQQRSGGRARPWRLLVERQRRHLQSAHRVARRGRLREQVCVSCGESAPVDPRNQPTALHGPGTASTSPWALRATPCSCGTWPAASRCATCEATPHACRPPPGTAPSCRLAGGIAACSTMTCGSASTWCRPSRGMRRRSARSSGAQQGSWPGTKTRGACG